MEKTVADFLKYQRIPISQEYLETLIQSHPDYPSLVSVGDTLEQLGISYNAWKTTGEELYDIDFPYLLIISTGDAETIMIKGKDDLIKYSSKIASSQMVILQISRNDLKLDKRNSEIVRKERVKKTGKIFLLFAASALSLLPVYLHFDIANFLLLITSLVGIVVGFVLVAKDVGIRYDLIESFCTSGKDNDCDRVLNSNESILLNGINLSDMVITYFIFQFICVLFQSYLLDFRISVFGILFGASVLSIPIVLISLYYQYAKIKTWCVICLFVSSLLLIQNLIFFLLTTASFSDLSLFSIALSLILFVCVAIVNLLTKDFFKVNTRIKNELVISKRVKNSINVFGNLLYQQQRIDYSIQSNEIVLGNRNATIRFIVASNMYCSPCKEQHKYLSRLVALHPSKIGVFVRILPSSVVDDDNATVTQYFIQCWREKAFMSQSESVKTDELLTSWYNTIDFARFKRLYPISGRIDLESKKLENYYNQWIRESKIVQTPTVFINGFKMPKYYNLEDLSGLMPSLLDYFNSSGQESTLSQGEVLSEFQ